MKKTKKALASLAIAGMALTMVPFNAFAAGTVPTRLAGVTAEQTAVQIAEQVGCSGTAILASSAPYGASDALTAGPLAAFVKAPILLQGPEATLNADTQAELKKLNVNKVYVTSGNAVIKQSVLDQLAGMGISVEPLGGVDRFETSVKIAQKMIELGAPVKKVAVAYGWLNQDALSIAAIASANNAPIILTEKSGLSDSAKAFLKANPAIAAADVIGGTGVIDQAVLDQLPSPTRHFGQTAYDTNSQVIQDFASSLKFDNVYVANGVTGIDALAGAPLAAKTQSPIVLTDGVNVPSVATFVHGKLSSSSVVTALGGTAVVSDTIRTGVVTGQVNPSQGALAVSSVTAASASSFQVVFNQAPADTSKITFTVANQANPVTVSTTWDTTNTTATLSGSSNFPEATYTVDVKNDGVDLGSNTVSITQQKISKITINSTKLAITQPTTGSGIGFASYTVYDQYNNDVTSGYLANNINWQCGVGTITTPSKGILEVTPTTTNLLTFSTVVITGYDSSSGVSTSATLNTSTAMGTLSSITINKLTNSNNAVLTAGDTSNTWYIDYSAKDMSGNDTKDYNLVKNGLILTGANLDQLSCSDPDVTAKVIQDPNDSNKAAIQVQVSNNNIQTDMPVTITAMSYQGAPSSLSLTLKKQATLDNFTLMAPSYNIASGEYQQIPFVAYDQNGNQLTKFSDLDKGVNPTFGVTLSGGAQLIQNPDGTASLWVTADTVTGNQSVPQIITAVTSTGKLSSLTLNIQKPVQADTLQLDTTKLITAMQAPTAAIATATNSAIQRVDFGYNYNGLTVQDQYARTMDMVGGTYGASNYEVLASSSDTTVLTVSGVNGSKVASGAAVAYGSNGIQIQSAGVGTASVTFTLVNKSTPTVAIDTKSVTISVLKNTDVKGYTIDTVAKPIYTTTTAAITMQQNAYDANPNVYGTTAAGGKVVLAGNCVTGAYVDSSDFTIDAIESGAGVGNSTQLPNGYDSVYVSAKALDVTKTGSSCNLTVSVLGADGLYHTVVTPITSSTVDPVANNLYVYVDTTVAGISESKDNTTIYIDPSQATATAALAPGKVVQRFDANGGKANRSSIYFYTKDSYGTKGTQLSNIAVVSSQTSIAAGTFVINPDGTIVTNNMQNNDYVTLTGVTANGLIQTVKIKYGINPAN